MTRLTYLLNKGIKNGVLEDGKRVFEDVISPLRSNWAQRRKLGMDVETAFSHFKNTTLPMFKEAITTLFEVIPPQDKKAMTYLINIDEKINEANTLKKPDTTLMVRYGYEVTNALMDIGYRVILADRWRYIERKKGRGILRREIRRDKRDIGYALNRYISSYRRSKEAGMIPPKGIYDTSSLGQAQLKFAYDEVVSLKLAKPLLPNLNERNYERIISGNPQVLHYISLILERKTARPGALRFYISKYGLESLCIPAMSHLFVIEEDYEIISSFIKMVGYIERPKPRGTTYIA